MIDYCIRRRVALLLAADRGFNAEDIRPRAGSCRSPAADILDWPRFSIPIAFHRRDQAVLRSPLDVDLKSRNIEEPLLAYRAFGDARQDVRVQPSNGVGVGDIRRLQDLDGEIVDSGSPDATTRQRG